MKWRLFTYSLGFGFAFAYGWLGKCDAHYSCDVEASFDGLVEMGHVFGKEALADKA